MNEDLRKYVGRRFGRLEVIDVDHDRRWYVVCKCLCKDKTVKSIKIYSLLNGLTRSCGCLHKETVKNVVASKSNNHETFIKQSITKLKRPPNKRNKTGVKGVCVGDYNELSEAKAARKRAEKVALDELNKLLQNKKSVD